MPYQRLGPGGSPGGQPAITAQVQGPSLPLPEPSDIALIPWPAANTYTTLNIYPRGGNDYSQFFSDPCPSCGNIHHLWSRDPFFTCFAGTGATAHAAGWPPTPYQTNIVAQDLPSGDLNDVIYAGSFFVAVGRNTLVYTQDGLTWQKPVQPVLAGNWQCLTGNSTTAPTIIVMVGYNDYGQGIVARSTDARSGWGYISMPTGTGPLNFVYWDGSQFIIVGRNCAFNSTDGITWTAVTGMPAGNWVSIAYDGSTTYIAIDSTGKTVSASAVGSLIASTAIPVPVSDIVYSTVNATFVAVGPSAACYTGNGVLWTSQTIPAGSYNAVINDGVNVIAIGTGVLATTTNLTAWTARTMPSAVAIYTDVYNLGTGLYVAVAQGAIAAVSLNRVTWTATTPKCGYELLRAGLVVET